MELEFKISKINETFLKSCNLTNQFYSFQDWVSKSDFLSKIQKIETWYRDMDANQFQLLDNGLRYSEFPYALFLFEFRIKNKPDLYPFKALFYADIDIYVPKELEETDNRITYLLDNTDLGERYHIWRTGRKGFRFIKKFNNDIRDLSNYIVYLSPISKAIIKEFMATSSVGGDLIKEIGFSEEFNDKGVLAEGRGIKMDMYPHPITKIQPTLIWNVNSPYNYSEPMENLRSAVYIAEVWIEIILIIEKYANVLFTEEYISQLEKRSSPSSIIIPRMEPPRPMRSPNGSWGCLTEEKEREVRLYLTDFFLAIDNDVTIHGFTGTPSPVITMVPRVANRECPIHKRVHTFIKHYYYWVPSNKNKYHVCCFSKSAPSSPSPFISGEQYNIPSSSPIFDIEESFLDPPLRKYLKEECSGDYIKFNSAFIGDLYQQFPQTIDSKLVMIKSGMGTGKTQSISKILSDEYIKNPNTSILGISTRRTSAGFLANHFGCFCYFNEDVNKRNLYQYTKLIISMESLHKIHAPDRPDVFFKYDIIILDEIESILSVILSETIRDKRKNFKVLKKLLGTTKKIFAMDALLNKKTLNYFKNISLLAPSKFTFLHNQMNQDPSTYLIYQQSQFLLWKWKMKNLLLLENKKIVVISDSKKILFWVKDYLNKECKELNKGKCLDDIGKKTIFITGSSRKETKETSIETNAWEIFDLIMYTPVITVGNSFSPPNPENNKDCLFAAFKGIVTASVALQMCGRFRVMKMAEKHVIFFQFDEKLPTLLKKRQIHEIMDETHQEYLMRGTEYYADKLIAVSRPPISEYGNIDKYIVSIPKNSSELTDLYAECKEEQHLSKHDILNQFIKVLKETNIRYVAVETGNISEKIIKANKSAVSQMLKNSKILNEEKGSGKDKMMTEELFLSAVDIFKNLGNVKEDVIREELTLDLFVEFQNTHIFSKGTISFFYLFTLYRQNPFSEFGKEFEKLKLFPDENCTPFNFLFEHLSNFFKMGDFPPLYHYKGFLDDGLLRNRLDGFFNCIKTLEKWELFWEICPRVKTHPEELKLQMRDFFEIYVRHIGIPYEKIAIKKVADIHRVNKNFPPSRFKVTGEKKKPANMVYMLNEKKFSNMLIMVDFIYKKKELPDDYPFKKFFASPENNTSNLSLDNVIQ